MLSAGGLELEEKVGVLSHWLEGEIPWGHVYIP